MIKKIENIELTKSLSLGYENFIILTSNSVRKHLRTILRTMLVLLLFGCCNLNKALAIGETCSNPIVLGAVSNNLNWNSYSMSDRMLYISFIADSTNVRIITNYGAGGYGDYPEWKSINLYNGAACTNPNLVWSQNSFNPIDSTFQCIIDSNIIFGNLYTLELKRKYNPDTCNTCNDTAYFEMSISNFYNPSVFHLHACDDECQMNCNGDFSTLDVGCIGTIGPPYENPFDLCPVDCWARGTNSPQIFQSNWAAMWASNGACESIITDLGQSLLVGEVYYISFDLMQEAYAPITNFNVVACNNFTPGFACGGLNGLTQGIFSGPPNAGNNPAFLPNVVCFTNTSNIPFTRIAFWPQTMGSQQWAYFDNLFVSRLASAGCNDATCGPDYPLNEAGCPIPNATYAWTGPLGVTFDDATLMNPVATFPINNTGVPIAYTLTITVSILINGNVCTDNDDVIITILPQMPTPILTGTSFTACNQTIDITVANCNTATFYTATVIPNDPGNVPTFVVNGCVITVTCYNGFGGTIIVNDHIPCSPNAIYYIQDCCNGPTPAGAFEVLLTDANSSDIIAQFGSSTVTYPDWIYINGVLTIDQSISLINCPHIEMGPAAEIVITNNATLLIDNCNLSACDKMWYGIKIVDGDLYAFSNTIRDAQYAVHAYDNATNLLRFNNFHNNFVSFYIAPTGGILNNIGAINSNDFATISPLVSGYLGQSPPINAAGFAGIIVNDVGYFYVGHSNTNVQKNVFRNLNCGILSYNTNFHSENNLFNNIVEQGGVPAYAGLTAGTVFNHIGTGVFCGGTMGNIASVIGDPNADMEFTDCFRGVYFEILSGDILHNSFGTAGTLFGNRIGFVLANIYFYANIINNEIVANQHGIRTRNCSQMALIAIDDNTVTIDNPGSNTLNRTGILIENVLQQPTQIFVRRNTVNMNDARRGIALNNIAIANVLENVVNMGAFHPGLVDVGILLNGSDQNNIDCNNVTGLAFHPSIPYTPLTFAFDFQTSKQNVVSCNHTDNTDVAFRFLNDCGFTDFKSNEIDEHWQGLRIQAAPNMGKQTDKGNHWNYLIPGYPALGASLTPLTGLTMAINTFEVLNGPPTPQGLFITHPTHNVNAGLGLEWFVNSFILQSSCANYYCNSPVRDGDDDEISALDMQIANNSVVLTEFEDQTKFEFKKALNTKLETYPNLMAGNSVLTNFYTASESSSIGTLKAVNNSISNVSQAELNLFTNIGAKQDLINGILSNLQQLSTTLQNATTVTAIAKQQYWDTCATLHNAILNSATDVAQYDDMQSQKKLIAKAQNEQVTCTDIFDNNIKAVNEIYLSGKLASAFTQEEKDLLYSIAYQCPFSGGVGVFQARVLVSLYDDNVEYDDNTTCELDGYAMRQTSNAQTQEKISFSVLPNPSKNYFDISATGIVLKNSTLFLYDAFGNVVHKVVLMNDGINRVDISTIASGVYQICLLNGFERNYSRLVIVK